MVRAIIIRVEDKVWRKIKKEGEGLR